MQIGVLCSGGDAPGMNAALRAVVLTAAEKNWKVWGIRYGFEGLIDDELIFLNSEGVQGIARHGGTILGSARSTRFFHKEGREKAASVCKQRELEALVIIGGDGSYRGAAVFQAEWGVACVGIPGTIDNDLYGTDATIGFHTAVQTAVEAIDKIMDTAESHGRTFIIEVMGRDAGHIAATAAAAAGAHACFIPEQAGQLERLTVFLDSYALALRRKPLIIVYSEGENEISRPALETLLKTRYRDLDVRSVVLGHIQRGGSPVVADRLLASRLGREAILCLSRGQSGVALGLRHDGVHTLPLSECTKGRQSPSSYLLDLVGLGFHEWK
ncbi:MAG: ATP-dependent 6-phosphofructokinase [Flavobacteriales bacterium]|nr:ATP-dependent 6-phosphofructokinase [Flavobacteriales bacterium]MCX7769371.1 ATP-dependent 6-phosphofructokinase [Flavobacteriales bacterium]MDW8410880.1 ATP-dependent 6-phosphofructokinase [Flavobacteriales bacterium]